MSCIIARNGSIKIILLYYIKSRNPGGGVGTFSDQESESESGVGLTESRNPGVGKYLRDSDGLQLCHFSRYFDNFVATFMLFLLELIVNINEITLNSRITLNFQKYGIFCVF